MSYSQSFFYSGPAPEQPQANGSSEENMGYPVEDSYLLYFLETIVGLVIVVFLLYILGHPDSPLKDYIDPETVPEIPVLPSHYENTGKSRLGLTAIEILLIWFAVLVGVLVVVWRNHNAIAKWLNKHAPNWAREYVAMANNEVTEFKEGIARYDFFLTKLDNRFVNNFDAKPTNLSLDLPLDFPLEYKRILTERSIEFMKFHNAPELTRLRKVINGKWGKNNKDAKYMKEMLRQAGRLRKQAMIESLTKSGDMKEGNYMSANDIKVMIDTVERVKNGNQIKEVVTKLKRVMPDKTKQLKRVTYNDMVKAIKSFKKIFYND